MERIRTECLQEHKSALSYRILAMFVIWPSGRSQQACVLSPYSVENAVVRCLLRFVCARLFQALSKLPCADNIQSKPDKFKCLGTP